MTNERSSIITIGGEQYEMILTTRATKAISNRYGGLDNLGDKLMKSENMEMALDEIIWLITLLCNQSIEIHNLRNSEKKPLLTEETVELLTSPQLHLGSEEVWLMPFGFLLDLWECHKQFMGIAKPKREADIDEVVPMGI